jgi:anaerobic carbon-monoxide dehydrogenase iron sulfur subunit
MEKILTVDYQKCTGCRLCELVCSVSHDGISNPSRSRITVIKWEDIGVYVPMICQQCENAPCESICPVGAIKRDEDDGFLGVDYNICIGCRSCVSACPFGAMAYNKTDKRVFKCDLCGGKPQCVMFCEEKAIDYVPAETSSNQKKKEAAIRFTTSQQHQVEVRK